MSDPLPPDLTQADCDALSDDELVSRLLDCKEHIHVSCEAANAFHRDREEASKRYCGTGAEWIEAAHQAGRDLSTAKTAVLARMRKVP